MSVPSNSFGNLGLGNVNTPSFSLGNKSVPSVAGLGFGNNNSYGNAGYSGYGSAGYGNNAYGNSAYGQKAGGYGNISQPSYGGYGEQGYGQNVGGYGYEEANLTDITKLESDSRPVRPTKAQKTDSVNQWSNLSDYQEPTKAEGPLDLAGLQNRRVGYANKTLGYGGSW